MEDFRKKGRFKSGKFRYLNFQLRSWEVVGLLQSGKILTLLRLILPKKTLTLPIQTLISYHVYFLIKLNFFKLLT